MEIFLYVGMILLLITKIMADRSQVKFMKSVVAAIEFLGDRVKDLEDRR